LNNDRAADARNAMKDAHPAAESSDGCLDLDDVARVHGTAVSHALDPGEEGQTLTVLRFRENQDRTDLGNRFGQDRRRQHRRLACVMRQVPLVQCHVFDADDALIGDELGNPIDKQEWISMREDALDRRVVERKGNVHAW
jgi:hypothetical protein